MLRLAPSILVVLLACEQQAARAPIPGSRDRGRDLFRAHCVLCHGAAGDGHGARREGLASPPADFTSSTWRRRASVTSVTSAIREGRRGTSMPAWAALSDQQVADLASYVLAIAELGP